MATLPASPQQAYISLQAYLGAPDYSHETVIDFNSASTFPNLTAAVMEAYDYLLVNGASYTAVNLATQFPAISNAVFIAVMDVTVPGQTFGISTASASGLVTIAPSCWWSFMPNGGALPTIYLTNTNATSGLIRIAALSN